MNYDTGFQSEHFKLMKNLQYSGKKVLVTGASGFIGSHLCHRLYDRGAEVHAIYRSKESKNNDNLHWWQCNLKDIKTIRDIFIIIKPDIIFHLASHVVGSRNLEVVLTTFNSNLASTVNLLTTATEIGCQRIILIGSLEEPAQNNTHAIPSSPYAAAKWAGNAYARMFYELYQTPVTIARLFMVYGPGQRDLNKLIPYVTLSLLQNEVPKLTSGRRQVDWIYVEDVVDGLIEMAKAPHIEGATIDLGSGILVSIHDVVQQLVDIIKANTKPLFGAVPDRPMEQIRVANIENTNKIIGWKPTTPLKNGVEQTVNWYRDNIKKTKKHRLS